MFSKSSFTLFIIPSFRHFNILSCKLLREDQKFFKMCESYYGDENYSDHDIDQIIDSLDYGIDMISFETFDQIMREINTKKEE